MTDQTETFVLLNIVCTDTGRYVAACERIKTEDESTYALRKNRIEQSGEYKNMDYIERIHAVERKYAGDIVMFNVKDIYVLKTEGDESEIRTSYINELKEFLQTDTK